ncbi:MAG TPA: MFS transporter [Micromonospora sp.]|nr:MFS transporter [Micromonospora sp.]
MTLPDLRLLLAAQGVSTAGTGFSVIALSFYLSRHGPVVISLVVLAEFVPSILLAGTFGKLVDRYPNRRLVVVGLLGQAAATVLLIAAVENYHLVLPLALIVGAGGALAQPAVHALLPRISGETNATKAYSHSATVTVAAGLTGQILGGVALTAMGIKVALLVDALSFFVAAGLMAAIATDRRPGESTSPDGAPGQRPRSGWATLLRHRLLAASVLLNAVSVGTVLLINVSNVFFVTQTLRGDSRLLAALSVSWGIGLVAGARLAGTARLGPRIPAAMWGATLLLGCAVAGAGLIAKTVPVLLLWFVGGAATGTVGVASRALIRQHVEDSKRGRVFAAASAAVSTVSVAAIITGGQLVQAVGPRLANLGIGTGTVIVAGLLGLVILVRRQRSGGPDNTELPASRSPHDDRKTGALR